MRDNLKLLLLRYEDVLRDPGQELEKAVAFRAAALLAFITVMLPLATSVVRMAVSLHLLPLAFGFRYIGPRKSEK